MLDRTIQTIPQYSHQCFWDQDYTALDPEKSRKYIITRVISYGSTNDIKLLFDYYGWDLIKNEVITIRYLNKKILNWLSCLFGIQKEKFRCFNNTGVF